MSALQGEWAASGDADDPTGGAKDDAILVVDGMRRVFGGLTAVDVDHLEVSRGKITALIGPNGAGKSTLFNLITGFDRPDSGTTVFDGRTLGRTRTHKIARLGLVRSFQLTRALSRLTVLENMLLAGQDQRGENILLGLLTFPWQAQEAELTERADALLQRFKLDHMRDQRAGTLSGGQRKLLDMARALMSDPKLVCLDEPMAGVNPALTQSLLGHVQALRDEGKTVIFVEHDIDVVMEISDWVVVMASGRVVAEGTPQTISRDHRVIEAYLGEALPPEVDHEAGEAQP
ncbi:ABC transporter ATP-binding protein [Iamia majanohamensis]|uniref:ABC transporter ATP-binding protein n=1 Tax=Iamia majanohamensis TaxID=467976 RepID=A0AAE9Y9T8_9ACTN|nr:ABC transporter ATP-binding protein [Iamia majanohamensis]WCO69222.1 ABC transporter ATP-binding protein [Iamia majanohamensis]